MVNTGQHSRRWSALIRSGIVAGLLWGSAPVSGAEVVGAVEFKRTGLFRADAGGAGEGAVSVSLMPLEGQRWPSSRKPLHHQMQLKDKQVKPSFLTARPGDTVEFVNHDDVYHELFALSPAQPIEARLGKASQGADARHKLELHSTGTWHLFCRIHSRMYARIDAIESQLMQEVPADKTFRFKGLAKGRWHLRAAALGAETRYMEVVALTAPPPVKIELYTKGGGPGKSPDGVPVQSQVEQLYPKD